MFWKGRAVEPANTPVGKPSDGRDAGQRWITLVQFLVVRNVAVAAIITVALAAVLYLVLAELRRSTAVAPASPSATPSAISSLPQQLAFNGEPHAAKPAGQPIDQTTPQLPPAPTSPGMPELITPPQEMMAKAMPPPTIRYHDGEQYLDASFGNVATVESTPEYLHQIVTLNEGQYYHVYTFYLKCGHSIMTTPDPYRNVMYKYPEQVAAEYQLLTCKSCVALQEALAQQKAK